MSGRPAERPAERPKRIHARWTLTVSRLRRADGRFGWTCRWTAQTGTTGDPGRIRSTKGAFEAVGLFLFTGNRLTEVAERGLTSQRPTVPPLAVCNRNTVTTSGQ